MARLREIYRKEIVPMMMKRFGYESIMQVPRLQKITLNMGVGEAVSDKKVMNFALEDLTRISGQKPVVTLAKKSIAGFKIREQWPIGCKVTLRNSKMYEFFDRLVTITLPRVRDFRGLNPKSFDGTGNYSLGINEQIVFPEIDFDKIDVIRGLDICITTSAKTDEEAKALLEAFNLPLKDRDKK
ncbi:MAG: 50S ribosomal protein L5 [Legionellales bacterium]|nr:50S ribosomal protein L5 [Legionellales bacterium]